MYLNFKKSRTFLKLIRCKFSIDNYRISYLLPRHAAYLLRYLKTKKKLFSNNVLRTLSYSVPKFYIRGRLFHNSEQFELNIKIDFFFFFANTWIQNNDHFLEKMNTFRVQSLQKKISQLQF